MNKNLNVFIIFIFDLFLVSILFSQNVNSTENRKVQKRIQEINRIIRENKLNWQAGKTSLSLLSDKEFKQLCGD